MANRFVWHGIDFGKVVGYRLVSDQPWQYETAVKFGCFDIGCYCSTPEWIPTDELMFHHA